MIIIPTFAHPEPGVRPDGGTVKTTEGRGVEKMLASPLHTHSTWHAKPRQTPRLRVPDPPVPLCKSPGSFPFRPPRSCCRAWARRLEFALLGAASRAGRGVRRQKPDPRGSCVVLRVLRRCDERPPPEQPTGPQPARPSLLPSRPAPSLQASPPLLHPLPSPIPILSVRARFK